MIFSPQMRAFLLQKFMKISKQLGGNMLKVVKNEYVEPNDLMSIKELCQKRHFKYGYLYKISCLTGEVKVYPRGGIKLSESEVLAHEENKRKLKYGRN